MGADASRLVDGVGGGAGAGAQGGTATMTDEEFRSRSISKMDSEMRKKYAQGAKYNFKVSLVAPTTGGSIVIVQHVTRCCCRVPRVVAVQ